MIDVKIYNQSDPSWKDVTLGSSGLTVGKFGCLVSCLSSMVSNMAKDIDPGRMAKALTACGGFSSSGDLYMAKVEQAVPGVFFKDRIYTTIAKDLSNTQKTDINTALERIKHLVRLGMPVPVNVDLIGGDGISDHWVLVVDSDFTVMDPAFGERAPFSKRYGTPETGIYGYASFIISPINFPDDGFPALGQAKYRLASAVRGINRDLNIKEAYDLL